jgi:FkbM family methyltransferase
VLRKPRAALGRRRLPPDVDGFGRAMFELHDYSRAIGRFANAVARDPDLLTTADLDATSVAIDAGAHVGEWSRAVASRYPATVHAYEPNPKVHDRLVAAVRDLPSVHVHALALGDRDATVPLQLTGPGATTQPTDREVPTVPITMRDSAAAFDELGVEHIALLKLNIEGGEYDVLDRLIETAWIARVDAVSVQFHEWWPRAHHRRREIRRALRRTHDEVWCYPWVWELWRAG